MRGSERLYSALVQRDTASEHQMSAVQREAIAPNGLRLVLANSLQSSGDQIINASTVLPWLFAALGVPPALTGLLVPIRESGSMLPQAFLTPVVLRVRYRKWVFVAGAVIQAGAVGAMAVTATLGDGLATGLVIVAALAVFAVGRCLCSISSKDVQGRTVPKGERGQVNGVATTVAGFVAISLGLAIRGIGGQDLAVEQLIGLLVIGVVLWAGVAAVYASIREPADEIPRDADTPEETTQQAHNSWFVEMLALLRDDKPFRHFVTVRSLLLVSSLSPPFIVIFAVQSGASSLTGLGGFIIASGLAALIGGRLFGRFADRSSKKLMSVAAATASGVLVAMLILVGLPGFRAETWWGNLVFTVAYFLVTLMHTGIRLGRKTYVVDMAQGDQRTMYVAVSNSAMGCILLIIGGLSSALALLHVGWALLLLAMMGILGVLTGTRLPEVSRGEKPSATAS